MDEKEFVASRQAVWERLGAIVAKASGANGLKSLPRQELRDLGPLYRRVASDLAYARAHAVSPQLTASINQLAARSFALLYQTDTRGWGGLLRFFTHDFPDTFRRRLSFFLASVGFMLLGTFSAYFLVVRSHENLDIFIPKGSQIRKWLDHWSTGKVSDEIPDAAASVQASGLMANNIQVSFNAFAFGALGGVPTVFVMFYNGAIMGSFAGQMTYVHKHSSFWPAILPHGVVELSETCLAGAAGLSLGWALLVPGAYRRRDAFVLAARDSVKLIIGGIFLLIFAGLVEAFISHSLLNRNFKIVFGTASGVALYSYLFLAGRTKRAVQK